MYNVSEFVSLTIKLSHMILSPVKHARELTAYS